MANIYLDMRPGRQELFSSIFNLFLCFAATHDIELTELLADCYDNYHFEEEIMEGDILFNYILRSGKAMTRNAIRLLGIIGYENAIIEEANALAAHFLETGNWT